VTANISDVQAVAGGDYDPSPAGPDTTLVARLRLTDSANGPGETDPGTTVDFEYPVGVACTATGGSIGSLCSVSTTMDAVTPGAIRENKQTVIQMFRLRLHDAGPNGTANDADDRRFASQGIYIP
jgi:hypothetical protein